jgi:hypothetical protein
VLARYSSGRAPGIDLTVEGAAPWARCIRLAKSRQSLPGKGTGGIMGNAGSQKLEGFLYSGKHHDSVPRALLLDKRLTPLERNAWQVLRTMLNEEGITTFPVYDRLSHYLTSIPCGDRASHETVARALTVLRLTRWISLVGRRRDAKTGQMLSNLYILHDEPLAPYEAIQLDADYLPLVSRALDHRSKAINRVGIYTLKEITEDPYLAGRTLPTRLHILTQRLAGCGWPMTCPQEQEKQGVLAFGGGARKSEEGRKTLLRNGKAPATESEEGGKADEINRLRNPENSTVRSSNNIKIRTVPRARDALCLPERFRTLEAKQQSAALAALQSVDADLHQAILDEWDMRCRKQGVVRQPGSYLFGLITKALRGEFHAVASLDVVSEPSPRTVIEKTADRPASHEIARQHLAHIRTMMRMPPAATDERG